MYTFKWIVIVFVSLWTPIIINLVVKVAMKVDKYKLGYGYYMYGLNGQNLYPKDTTDVILPPPERRLPGRPQKNRRKEIHEDGKSTGVISRKGRKMQCQNCGQYGHNKKGCKNKTVHIVKTKKCGTSQQQKKRKETPKNKDDPKNVRKKAEGFGIYISQSSKKTTM